MSAIFSHCITPFLIKILDLLSQVGNTDTRWYWDLSDQIFRFSPVKLTLLETKMFHGINEKISTDALSNIVDFYKMLVMMEDECSLDALNEKSPLVT